MSTFPDEKPADTIEKTYVSFYSGEDTTGSVLGRQTILLPWNHGNTWRAIRRRADKLGARSFAIFRCMDVHNHDPEARA
jgi:hypothetical protein